MGRPQNIDRNAVLDAAEAIVLERGAAELTIDAVAQSVGITKGGVQYCFGTKAGLIEAMVERWCREFQAEIDHLTSPTDDPIAAIGGYVEATAKINKLTHARAAGMMAVLLQSPEHMAGVRKWYHEHLQPLDLSTPAGKKARIAFMAMEGAFLLRSFGFMQMSDTEWGELFGEIKAALPATPSASDPNGTLQAANAPATDTNGTAQTVARPSAAPTANKGNTTQFAKAATTQADKGKTDDDLLAEPDDKPSAAEDAPEPEEDDDDKLPFFLF